MAAKWVKISEHDAKAHPLYGLRWVWLFLALLVISAMSQGGELRGLAYEAKLPVWEFVTQNPLGWFLFLASLIKAFIAIAISALAVMKSRNFRLISSILLLLSWPTLAATSFQASFPGGGVMLGRAMLVWLLWLTVWLTYLHTSQRVRVTFEHYVRVAAAPKATPAKDGAGET